MDPLTASMLASTVFQGIGLGTDIAGGIGAKKELRKQKREARAAENWRWREELRDLRKQEEALAGTQRAGLAGAGVRVGLGTAREILTETQDEFDRLVQAGAEVHHQRLQQISANSIPGPNYMQGAARLVTSIGSTLDRYRNRPGQGEG